MKLSDFKFSLPFFNKTVDLTVNISLELAQKFKDLLKEGKEYTLDIKEVKKSRTLSANAYFWTLCNKLAIALNSTSLEIYKELIKKYGVSRVEELKGDFAKTLIIAWGKVGLGWFVEEKDIDIYTFYYGSSSYNTKQMKRLIDHIIDECQEQGIETKTPDQIAEMMALMERSEGK